MAEQVEYEITLKDMLTPKLKEAEAETSVFEQKLHQAGNAAEGIGGKLMSGLKMLGIGFAFFKGAEMIKDGMEAVEKLHQAQAQVAAGLESTGHAAGLTAKDLDELAKQASASSLYGRAALTSMQSVLLTFPSITKATFPQATEAIMNMSTRLGNDLNSSAIQVGKALQDPIKGITALRRVGVNFNEAQTEMVKKMVLTGHTAQAQAYILKELQTEFGGSAKAAFEADPSARFNKAMKAGTMTMGEAAMAIKEELQPALLKLAQGFITVAGWVKDSVHWMGEHKDIVVGIAAALGIMAGYYTIVTVATTVWTTAQWLLNTALTANPIGLVVAAIGVLVGAIVYAWNHFVGFRAVVMGLWGVLKEFASIVTDVFLGVGKTIHGVTTFNIDEIKSGATQAASAMYDAGTRIGSAYKQGHDAVMADFAKEQSAGKAGAVTVKAKGTAPSQAETPKDISPKGATGQKVTTINVTIGNLIEKFSVQTTTISEGAGKVRELVAQALLSAVNDSQITAGI